MKLTGVPVVRHRSGRGASQIGEQISRNTPERLSSLGRLFGIVGRPSSRPWEESSEPEGNSGSDGGALEECEPRERQKPASKSAQPAAGMRGSIAEGAEHCACRQPNHTADGSGAEGVRESVRSRAAAQGDEPRERPSTRADDESELREEKVGAQMRQSSGLVAKLWYGLTTQFSWNHATTIAAKAHPKVLVCRSVR
jgi:hypothetical protein